ncbi:hypothetical protein LXL04_023604 [Taraxacum kok-saghyz]
MDRKKRCAVVTGGNKGIGFETCRQLALNDGIEVICSNDSFPLQIASSLIIHLIDKNMFDIMKSRNKGQFGHFQEILNQGRNRFFWDEISDQSFDSRLRIFLDMVDKDADGKITEDEVRKDYWRRCWVIMLWIGVMVGLFTWKWIQYKDRAVYNVSYIPFGGIFVFYQRLKTEIGQNLFYFVIYKF